MWKSKQEERKFKNSISVEGNPLAWNLWEMVIKLATILE
jgi:hypothetical protein